MTKPMNLAEIEAFWAEQAQKHGKAAAASWSDVWPMHLEVREIGSRLEDGDSVLDVGCANGYSTVRLAAQKRVRIRGIDYVPEMIENARARLGELEAPLAGSVEFDVGNVLALEEPAEAYDKVVLIRVLINLRTWENQQTALSACARAVRPGGCLMFSEASAQGHARLNVLRGELGLDPIPVPVFNEYLDDDRVLEFLSPQLELVEKVDFASSYYVGTRVLKPVLARAGMLEGDVANPLAEWNRWCAQLPAWGDYGVQKLFVFRKPA